MEVGIWLQMSSLKITKNLIFQEFWGLGVAYKGHIWVFLLPFSNITPFIVNYLELHDYVPGESIRSEMSLGDWTNSCVYIQWTTAQQAAK